MRTLFSFDELLEIERVLIRLLAGAPGIRQVLFSTAGQNFVSFCLLKFDKT
jgi:hypothetical protein